MSPEYAGEHLSLQILWACRQESTPLTEAALQHLYQCDECLRLLGLCQMAKTFEELVMRATDYPKTGT
jgi:hypothetical protein